MDLTAIHWGVTPEIFSMEEPFKLAVRWYGLLFATGFIVGQYVMAGFFKREGKRAEDIDELLLYMVFSTILGARLGHCLFYQPDFYLSNPIEILKIWEGGLASHGGAIGILLGLYLYIRKKPDLITKDKFDRVVIATAFGGFCIRLGNLMNSEIVGLPTDLPWGFVFERLGDDFARHPAQLYESLSCLLLFFMLYFGYQKLKGNIPEGQFFGIFLIYVFSLRIVYETLKENQVAFEEGMVMNMGQILSIPMVLGGIFLLVRSFQQPKSAPNKKL